jgi:hypothetical protein
MERLDGESLLPPPTSEPPLTLPPPLPLLFLSLLLLLAAEPVPSEMPDSLRTPHDTGRADKLELTDLFVVPLHL